jgi:glycine C-acetyltransferase
MYYPKLQELLKTSNQTLKDKGIFKIERLLGSPQGPVVKVKNKKVIMLASNNYLGIANNKKIVAAAKKALDTYGFGLSSVRFICGTIPLHLELEKKIAKFLHAEDAISFSSCFAANEAFFAAVTNYAGTQGLKSVLYSDELNHASIIDGLKLVSKENCVKRIYPHQDLATLEKMLKEDASLDYAVRMIITDGVFSMEGELAHLPKLTELATKYKSLLFVDDSHGLGACGKTGRGSIEELGTLGKIDVMSGTFSKAIGGGAGGYIAGKKELIDFLRQKARPYTFSNNIPPAIAAGSLEALNILEKSPKLLKQLRTNTEYFRAGLKKLGFEIIDGIHPIVPIMIKDAALTQKFSARLLEKGVYITGLWFPVVPENTARLRAQISAGHTKKELDLALAVLAKVGKELKVI